MNDDYKMTFRYEPRLTDSGIAIDEFLNGAYQSSLEFEDKVIKTTLIDYLRTQGYVVVPPEDVPMYIKSGSEGR